MDLFIKVIERFGQQVKVAIDSHGNITELDALSPREKKFLKLTQRRKYVTEKERIRKAQSKAARQSKSLNEQLENSIL